MEKFKSLSEYCESSRITIEELKANVTDAALALSTSAAHELTTTDIEVISLPLHEFNEILKSLE